LISASGATTFCEGSSVTLTAPVGYTYLWNNGAITRSIIVASSGSFNVTITNESGCSATSAYTFVTVQSLPPVPVITASGPTTFCQGGSVVLTAPAGYAYLWNNGQISRSITVDTTGNYVVTVTNAYGCQSVSDTLRVSRQLIAVNGKRTFCEGEEVVLYASEGFASYQWSRNGAAIPSQSGMSLTVSQPGIYTVTGSVTTGSCTSLPFQLSKLLPPELSIISTASSINSTVYENCGPARFSATANDVDNPGQPVAIAFNIHYEDGTEASIEGTVFSLSKSAEIEAFATSAAGCITRRNFTFLMNDKLTVPAVAASGPTSFCQGESVTLTAPEGYTYLWTTGATSRSITATVAGEYRVKIINGDGCSVESNPVMIMVNPINSSN
jgi:hypothetical protein